MLGVAPAGLGLPFREGAGWIGVVKMWACGGVKTCEEAADAKGTNSSLLCVLLLGLSDEPRDVFHRWVVIVVESVALALDPCLIGQDPSVSSEAGIGHMDVTINLQYLLDGLAVLQLGDCFFLDSGCITSTARMTDELVTSPTAQRPFLTA